MIEQEHIFDKRIIERNIQRGRITREQYEEFVKNLPDEAKKSDEITVEVREGEFKVEMPEMVEEE